MNQRFSLTTRIVAVLLIVGMVGLTGFGVWQYMAADDDPLNSSKPLETSTPVAPAPLAKDVAVYDPENHEFWPSEDSPDRPEVAPDDELGPNVGRRPTAPAPTSRDQYLDQPVVWNACEEVECARVVVPVDWDDPGGQAITLALARRPASGTSQGVLFVNPGGPGGSGTSMVQRYSDKDLASFDIVGWDPRGTGKSSGVFCSQNEARNLYLADATPDDDEEREALLASVQDYADSCRENSGDLLDHVSTLDTARDLDLLRHLLGSPKLNYLGISYGTYLGSTYAELYPDRVGRMVLDSAVNITRTQGKTQAQGFDRALADFADWCVDTADCELAGTSAAIQNRITALWDELDDKPLDVGGRPLTQTLAVTGTAYYLYFGASAYQDLAKALSAALGGAGQSLLQAADGLESRSPKGKFGTSSFAFPAIACTDNQDEGVEAAWDVWESVPKDEIFARYSGPELRCPTWTAQAKPELKIRAKGAPPIVVVGVTGDPATPYENAVSMAKQLDSGVLVTWKGAGHSALALGNDCVKDATTTYLVDGVVPKNNTTC